MPFFGSFNHIYVHPYSPRFLQMFHGYLAFQKAINLRFPNAIDFSYRIWWDVHVYVVFICVIAPNNLSFIFETLAFSFCYFRSFSMKLSMREFVFLHVKVIISCCIQNMQRGTALRCDRITECACLRCDRTTECVCLPFPLKLKLTIKASCIATLNWNQSR